MPQTFANTISLDGGTTNLPIYADRAEKDAAGNDIQTTYATKSEIVNADWDAVSGTPGYIENKPVIPEGVPTYTAAEEGKVLGVVEVSGSPALDWVALSGSSDIFYATYASTTFNEIQSAVNDGKYVILSRQGSLLPLTAIVGSSHFAKAYFQSISNPYNNESHNSLRLTTYICSYNNQWTFFNTFVPPESSASDAGKVLTVSSSGNAEWATPSGGGSVTDVEVNGTSVVNASGVAEVTVPAQVQPDWDATSGLGEILNKPTIPSGAQLVPAATSADADKVLTVDSLGVPGWAVVPAQSTGLFQAEYGTTSYADIVQAINDKKIVYCRLNSGASRMAFLAYIGSSNVEFQYYRSLSSHSASNMTDEVYVYTVSSSGWTTTTRKTGVKVVAGTHMSQSYSNDTLTLDCTWPDVDQTFDASSSNAQSGVAIAGELAGIEQVPAVTSSDDGKVLKATYSGGAGTYAWDTETDTTYSAGNMISIDPNNSNAIGVLTTAGITDVQQVNSLPAQTVPTVLYLIPET